MHHSCCLEALTITNTTAFAQLLPLRLWQPQHPRCLPQPQDAAHRPALPLPLAAPAAAATVHLHTARLLAGPSRARARLGELLDVLGARGVLLLRPVVGRPHGRAHEQPHHLQAPGRGQGWSQAAPRGACFCRAVMPPLSTSQSAPQPERGPLWPCGMHLAGGGLPQEPVWIPTRASG